MKMVNNEAQLTKIFRHGLLENGAIVGGYHELRKLQKDTSLEMGGNSEMVCSAKNVFFGYLESLVGADESIFPKWFEGKNARQIKNMANFDWFDGERYFQFYDWLVNYIEYLQNL